ncbi:hypothetical protein [Vibrio sp. SCSIO 43137]|uniref:hypothetical protein n=1 Tax=Vibrio sp. SCSIO 43137 TaxID=3021011 RepID=UPI002307ACE1|nr:hypothetical protein [Vibrio sp. SCSIO 43137]WCE31661.1 hypothetical protein PK654_21275 [Vibrio sp. SCSIO 43137]
MNKFCYLIVRTVVAVCLVLSTSAFAFYDPPVGKCKNISVSTYFVSLLGEFQPSIPAGSELVDSGAIGKIMGSFNFTCRTHWTSNNTKLGVYLSGSGDSHKYGSGPGAAYYSNIEGLELRLPPDNDAAIQNRIKEGYGMRAGTWGGESNAILIERYRAQAGYGSKQKIVRTLNVPIFYVYKIGNVPIIKPSEMNSVWLRSSTMPRFATYLNNNNGNSVWKSFSISGPRVEFYDPSCEKLIPDEVTFDDITPGETTYKNFSLKVRCSLSSFTEAPDIKIRFDVMESASVTFTDTFPTFATYMKDGMYVNLQLYDQNNQPIRFRRDIDLPSVGVGHEISIPFKAEISSVSGTETGNYAINVSVEFEYN